jgi:hypothetical protein
MFRRPLDVPFRRQWDPDSRLPMPDPGTAPGNCGMTVVTHMAQYYTDRWFGIFATRYLVMGNDLTLSSTVTQQSEALRRRGVENQIYRPDVDWLHRLVAEQRRPIGLGLDMSQVPLEIAGHDFRGSHGIELRATTYRDTLRGFTVMDPNFNTTYRVDPTNGHRFYPDWVINRAYYAADKWAIVPTADKLVPPPWWGRIRVQGPGVSIRESAKETAGNVYAKSRSNGYTYRERDNARLWRNTYEFYWNGETVVSSGIGFYRVKTHGGDTKYIRVGAAVITRKA